SWSGRWRARRCTGAYGRTMRRGLSSSALNSLPTNTSESRLPHGSVQSHHEIGADKGSRVEPHVAMSCARLCRLLRQIFATSSPLALLAKNLVTPLTLSATIQDVTDQTV